MKLINSFVLKSNESIELLFLHKDFAITVENYQLYLGYVDLTLLAIPILIYE